MTGRMSPPHQDKGHPEDTSPPRKRIEEPHTRCCAPGTKECFDFERFVEAEENFQVERIDFDRWTLEEVHRQTFAEKLALEQSKAVGGSESEQCRTEEEETN